MESRVKKRKWLLRELLRFFFILLHPQIDKNTPLCEIKILVFSIYLLNLIVTAVVDLTTFRNQESLVTSLI